MADVVERYRIVGENAVGAAFNQILRQSKSTADRMAGLFRTAFAGISLYSVGRLIVGQIEFNDALARGAIQSGIQAKAYTELAYAARQVDIDQSALATSLKKMQVSLSQAASGGKAQIQTLDALGLEIGQLKALEPDKQFEAIAEQISRIQDPADKTRAAVELFGRAGADLLPMFEKGAAGIREARDAAKEFGQSLTEADLEKFRQADDALDALKESGRGLASALTLELAPSFVEVSDKLQVMLGYGSRFKELEVRIRDLRREADSPIPLYFNFGYIDGAPVIMSPEKILEWIKRLRTEQLKLEDPGFGKDLSRGQRHAGSARYNAGLAGGANPPGFTTTAEELDKLKPVAVTAKKILEDYGAMLRDTATDAEKAAREYELFRIQLEKLQAAGLIDADEFNKRLGEHLDKAIPEVQVTAKKIAETKQKISELTVFAEQAARNMQDAFANFLFDPFDDGLKGMLRGFVDIIRRMAAEIAAAQLFGSSTGGGLIGAISGGIASLFGRGGGVGGIGVPTLAGGGFLRPGQLGIVGEEGPEFAFGGSSGQTIVPMSKAAGQRSVQINAPFNVTVNVDSRADAAAVRQDTQRTVREAFQQYQGFFHDQVSRGAFAT